MRRAGNDAGGDQNRQLTPLEVIRRRKRLPGAGPLALFATESWNRRGVEFPAIGAEFLKALGGDVSRALRPRTMRRSELRSRHGFDGVFWPMHALCNGKS